MGTGLGLLKDLLTMSTALSPIHNGRPFLPSCCLKGKTLCRKNFIVSERTKYSKKDRDCLAFGYVPYLTLLETMNSVSRFILSIHCTCTRCRCRGHLSEIAFKGGISQLKGGVLGLVFN